MTKVYGLTVIKNEGRRYLKSMLEHATEVVDELFLYDDQSDDGSIAIATSFPNVHVSIRPDGVPSFLEHEGRFRQDAWNMMQSVLPMQQVSDWVLAIDADEILISTSALSPRQELLEVLKAANKTTVDSVILPIPEVFGYDDDGTPMTRTDGLWGTIRGFRLFRYRPNGIYKDKAMGCGAEPTYVENGRKLPPPGSLKLVHMGYADQRDKLMKYRRYTELLNHGHNDNHVRSIITEPILCRWDGPKLLERAS